MEREPLRAVPRVSDSSTIKDTTMRNNFDPSTRHFATSATTDCSSAANTG